MCGSCHQLYTTARGKDGKPGGYLPEQMPYLEWLHSDYPSKYSCQGCHMPEVQEQVQISSVLGLPRTGMHQHVFVGGNFLMQQMLNRYRDELSVAALPQELTAASQGTLRFLQSQSARVELSDVLVSGGRLQAQVMVRNLTRTQAAHRVIPPDAPGCTSRFRIVMDIRSSSPARSSRTARSWETIMTPMRRSSSRTTARSPRRARCRSTSRFSKMKKGHVTTGLLAATGYLKDNRLIPTGFDKSSADKDIAVMATRPTTRSSSPAKSV